MAKQQDAASRSVQRAMHEFKQGRLKSGGSGRREANRKQALAIGLAQARRKGVKVPPEKR